MEWNYNHQQENNLCYTHYVQKIVLRNDVIFCQDKEKNIAFPIVTGIVMQDFFEEVLAERNKFIGLFYRHNWYYL